MSFDLAQFKIAKSVLELRYPENFLLWDKAGSFWAHLARSEDITVKQAMPNQTVVLVNRDIEASVGIDRSTIICAYPGSDLNKLRKLASVFVPNLIETFGLTLFTRIGMRTFFHLDQRDRRAAADFVFQHTPVPRIGGKNLNIEGEPLDPRDSP